MGNIKAAWLSPDISAGRLRFYAGDRFAIRLELELRDQDESPVELTPEDAVRIIIYDMPTVVWEKSYTELTENAVELVVDDDLGELLHPGEYEMRVVVEHGETVTTIAATTVEVWR